MKKMTTNEGSLQYVHSLNHHVEFFAKAGSIFDNNSSFYGNKEDIISLFRNAWDEDKEVAFKLLFHLRDCRGGSGNRSGFRKCLKWVAKNDPEWVRLNIKLIPLYGRWDDLRTLFNTRVESAAVTLWANALLSDDILAAKWAKRTDIPLYLRLKKSCDVHNMGDFRRFLSGRRMNHIVETKMCNKDWKYIDYSSVPSVAMARYSNAFRLHDEDGFNKFKENIVSGEVKINASVLFPHDCVRTVNRGDKDIANAQFDALPNYMNGDESIMVLCDSSGSMEIKISENSSVTAYDVSTSLALYCSGRLNKDNPFYKKFISFESESKFIDWSDYTFSDCYEGRSDWGWGTPVFDGAVGSTRIDKALDLLLNTGKCWEMPDDKMPKILLICSDMQFSNGSDTTYTEVESCMVKWDDYGYSRPKIVYWNLNPYHGSPDTSESKDVALVSGFSPSILKSILECDTDSFSPESIMMKALEKYEILVP